MARDLVRRLAALEQAAARRRPAEPAADDMPDFEAMSTEQLDAWLRDPPPSASAEDMPDFEAMSEEALGAYLADECRPASGDATR